jgi:hypothetical protein
MPLSPVPDAPKSAEIVALEKNDADLQSQIDALGVRVSKLEAEPATPPPAVVITVNSEVQTQLAKLVTGQAVVLRGPTDEFVLLVV